VFSSERPGIHAWIKRNSGYLCDRFSYTKIMLGIGITGTLASLLLFGLAKNLAMVLLFTLIFGWAAGSFCATWPASATDIARLRNMQSADVMISYTIMRGIAAIVGPLVAAKLYRPDLKADAAVFGSFGFRSLTIFVGIMMSLVAGLAVLAEFSRRMSFKGVDVKLLGERL
jgi:MFS family permease